MTELALREEQATARIHGICLKTGPPGRVGVELEWLVRDPSDPARPVPAQRIASAAAAFGPGTPGGPATALPSSSRPGALPSGAFLTSEPGGQLELSSLPADSLAGLISATRADLAALRAAVAAEGLELTGIGLDPFRPPRRVLRLPRYAAMEEFFDRSGPWGRQMMCGTASVQVCLDAGDDSAASTGYAYRWRLLHALGPVLVAAFANSPLREGQPTGWRSTRQQVWARMDAGRTRPPRVSAPDLRAAWASYALDAQVMCVQSDGTDWMVPAGLTLRDWLRSPRAASGPAGLRPAGPDDLDYHLSTLFPPVRPRGHFEIRMIDAQPGDDGWIVPLAVTTALLSDPRAADEALAAAERIWPGSPGDWPADGGVAQPGRADGNPWLTAARYGPADPAIARAARECFAAARAALDRAGVPEPVTAAVDAFTDTYVDRGRCPADDLLEETR
ncbi:MAG: ergothioneine biosynthesis glutamate--cysteine ligase EgtA [Streptosporangiales bacterium]|nr:ergothioneine biosynthesis glutamate--cysteine ligase EgtA [Streptosporangiales bacterium]